MAERIALVPRQAPGIADDVTGLLAPGALEALAMPVLLIEGAASPPVAHEIASALAARLPDARRMTVPGAGHMAPVTHPEIVGRAIAAHLGGA
jgi:pimeloyl-ACP methyl ester carboxylesterase